MSSLGHLPEKLILNPVQPVPLPKNWGFSWSWAAGWQPPGKGLVHLCVGNMPGVLAAKQDAPGPNGFNELTAAILGHAALHNLWNQSVPVVAAALDLAGLTYVARSNTQMLKLPVAPCNVVNPQNLVYTGTPDPVAPLGLATPTGRRLYDLSAPPWMNAALPRSWYVGPGPRLEDNAAFRGCDRYTFWLGVYAVCVKHGMGVATGEALAQRINAKKSHFAPYTGTLDQFVASSSGVGNNYIRTLMWTPSRVVVVDSFNLAQQQKAYEFDMAGLVKTPFVTWVAQQDTSAVWNFRDIHGVPNPVWGSAGLA